jgi:type I restriction enzyme M protein
MDSSGVTTRLFKIIGNYRVSLDNYIYRGKINLLSYISLCALDRGLDAESATNEDFLKVIDSCPLSDESRKVLQELVTDTSVAMIRSLMTDFNPGELRGIVLQRGSTLTTSRASSRSGDLGVPASLRKLAVDLLDIEDSDLVADFHCEDGTFLMDVFEANPNARVYGRSTSILLVCLAEVRMNLVGAEHLIERRSGFSGEHLRAFDKVYDTPPLGMRVAFLSEESNPYLKPLLDGTDPMGRPSSADWLYCRLAFDSLARGGTAIVTVTNGAVFNSSDIETRRYFVENGMVRAAIALPERLLTSTTIPLTLLVLGKNDGPIRLVDATDLGTRGRRMNTLSDDAVVEIEDRLSQDSDMSGLASREELAGLDYSLYPPRFLEKPPELDNPNNLGNLAVSIERGASIPARNLDRLTTLEDTGLYFLSLADISGGFISDDLLHLTSVDPSTERQWLRSGDLILSKNGAPFKVAVADVPDDRTILANGNLYIIRLDTERVDPYYVAAFLASEDGKRSLERMVTGTTIPNLPLRNLRNVQIPVPAMETQRRVATRYRANLDQVAILKIKLDAARAAVSASYDEEMGR